MFQVATAYGQLKVDHKNMRDGPLTLTFLDQDAQRETFYTLQREGFTVTDQGYGYGLCHSPTRALEAAQICIGKAP